MSKLSPEQKGSCKKTAVFLILENLRPSVMVLSICHYESQVIFCQMHPLGYVDNDATMQKEALNTMTRLIWKYSNAAQDCPIISIKPLLIRDV
jgi:hypothetical protein